MTLRRRFDTHRPLASVVLVWLVMECGDLLGQSPAARDTPDPSWQALDARTEALYDKGDLQGAIAVAREADAAAKSPFERGQSRGRLGLFLHESGSPEERKEASRLVLESLKIREAAFGRESIEYAWSAHDYSIIIRDTRDLKRYDEARMYAEIALTLRRRHLPAAHPKVAEAVGTLGSIHAGFGKFDTALPMLEDALRMFEAIAPETRPMADYSAVCINLAGVYQRQGRFKEALTEAIKGQDAAGRQYGVEHIYYLAGTMMIASIQVDLGDFGEAVQKYDEAIRVLERDYNGHAYHPIFLNNRGVMYRHLNNFAMAERDLEASIAIKKRADPRSYDVATTQANYGQMVYLHDQAEGERLLREAATIMAEVKAPPFEQANSLIVLAYTERARGALQDADATLRKALVIAEKLGKRHPGYAAALRELGPVQQGLGDAPGGRRSLLEALSIAEASYGSTSPHVLAFLRPLARFYQEQGEVSLALDTYRRIFEIEDRYLNTVFAIGTESFKERVLRSRADPVHALIAFMDRAGERLADARILAFEAATNSKGRLLEQIRHFRQRLRYELNEKTTPLVDELEALVRCRTSLTLARGDRMMAPSLLGGCQFAPGDPLRKYGELLSEIRAKPTPTPEQAARADAAVEVLEQREHAVEAELVRQLGPSAAPRARATIDSVAATLRPDEILIELIAYTERRSTGGIVERPGPRKYGAFVLDSRKQLSWVPLGDATPIETAVDKLMAAANDWSRAGEGGRRDVADGMVVTAENALAEITKSVWTPLERVIAGMPHVRRLRIAPDAALNLVPFEAILTRSGRGARLIDRFSIVYVAAGRDLRAGPAATSARPAVIVASPGGKTAPKKRAGFQREAPRRLVNAEKEVADLVAFMPDAVVAREQPMASRDRTASEQFVKGLVGPSILHLISHAWVDEPEPCRPESAEPSRRAFDEPCPASIFTPAGTTMVLSTMVLEEAHGTVAGSTEDGYLTAAELQDIDLRGTAMLVLSQCQMASGSSSVGEGVYGMRRAAAVAGVRTLVAPLWSVKDDVQTRLIHTFYDGLSAGRGRDEALREAKLAIKKSQATAGFLFWAPVIISGDTSPLKLSAK